MRGKYLVPQLIKLAFLPAILLFMSNPASSQVLSVDLQGFDFSKQGETGFEKLEPMGIEIEYVCNIEPYSRSPKMAVGEDFAASFSSFNFFPVGEYESYFVYLSREKDVVGMDRFQGRGEKRWEYAKNQNLFGCGLARDVILHWRPSGKLIHFSVSIAEIE